MLNVQSVRAITRLLTKKVRREISPQTQHYGAQILKLMMNDQMIQIVQHNLNGQRIASMQLRDYCAKNKINVALIQEPVNLTGKIYGFEDCRVVATENPGAAIVILDSELQVIELSKHTSKHIAAVRVGQGPRSLVLVSAYL